jgi:hypothetical protein
LAFVFDFHADIRFVLIAPLTARVLPYLQIPNDQTKNDAKLILNID